MVVLQQLQILLNIKTEGLNFDKNINNFKIIKIFIFSNPFSDIPVDRQDYYKNPDQYRSTFAEKIAVIYTNENCFFYI